MDTLLEDMVLERKDLEKYAIKEAAYRVEQILESRKDIKVTPEQTEKIYTAAEEKLVSYLMHNEEALNYDGMDDEIRAVIKDVTGCEL
jgi:hypothetical protein